MAEYMGDWLCKRRPISKIRPSDSRGVDAVLLVVERWYDFPEFGCHLGNSNKVAAMQVDSDWDALRARLAQLQEAVAAEIRAYPAPIPACDAQYNHLLERRAALNEARARLDAAREGGVATAEDFLAKTPLLAEG
jgi:hypothetical protein